MKTLEHIHCYFPKTLDEALTLLADERSRGPIIAGGTDIVVQWQAGAIPLPDCAISLYGIDELQQIIDMDDTLKIGAGVTHTQLRNSETVQRWLPALTAAAATVGAHQIQNRGTLGGNVANASPAGDTPPALLITDGTVTVASQKTTRTIPLAEFFLDYRKIDLQPDELICSFSLPKKPESSTELFRKLGTRGAQAISKVMAACRADLNGTTINHIAIAMGSVAATTVRLPQLEQWLMGKVINETTIAEAEQRAAEEVRPIADIRSTAEYRKWVSGRIIRGFLEQLSA